MGAGSRRARRRLNPAAAALRPLPAAPHPLLVPIRGVAYAALLGLLLFAVDQVASTDSQEPWLQLAGSAVVASCLLTAGFFAWTGWQRHREGVDQRGMLWGFGAAATAALGLVSLYVLFQLIDVLSLVNGADVHLTRPLIEALPRPPGASLVNEQPGPAQTETIYQTLRVRDLSQIPAFYRSALPARGWTEEAGDTAAGAAGLGQMLNFDKGRFVASVSLIQAKGAGEFTVSLTHLPPEVQASPSPSGTASPTPS